MITIKAEFQTYQNEKFNLLYMFVRVHGKINDVILAVRIILSGLEASTSMTFLDLHLQ
jgi:hypothetical protein